jgi:hypothetical protein
MEKKKTIDPMMMEEWIQSDWYKEWVRLSHINHPEPKKCGSWYYDSNSYKYIYCE